MSSWFEQVQFGENGFFAGRADDSGPHATGNEIEQRGNGLDVIPKTEVGLIVGVDSHDLHSSITGGQQFVQGGLEDLARAAPRRHKHRQNRFSRLQDFRRELGLADGSDAWFVLAHLHVFNCVLFLSAPLRSRHATDGIMQ